MRTNLVLQKNELMELEQSVNRIRQYEFFEEQNERDARGFSEAVLHSIYIQSPRQALIQTQELVHILNYDRSLKVIYLLRGIDIEEAKPFCFHSSEQDEQFIVRSRNLDWMVTPLSSSNELIPVNFIRGLSHLRRNGIKVDGVAIATPNKQMPLSQTVKEVLKEEAQRVGRASRVVSRAISDFATGVSDRMHDLAIERERRISERQNSSITEIAPNEATFLPKTSGNIITQILADLRGKFDPILLIKIGSSESFYVECGRWL